MTVVDALGLRQSKRLIFTNGVFDILHAGHVRYLNEAAKLGDLLIVGVNTDESVKMLSKGPGRPVNSLADRIEVLEALRAVSGAVAFSENTPENLIATLKPEVHVKGGDYRVEDLPEAMVIKKYGGEIVILPTVEGRSSTNIIKKLGLE